MTSLNRGAGTDPSVGVRSVVCKQSDHLLSGLTPSVCAQFQNTTSTINQITSSGTFASQYVVHLNRPLDPSMGCEGRATVSFTTGGASATAEGLFGLFDGINGAYFGHQSGAFGVLVKYGGVRKLDYFTVSTPGTGTSTFTVTLTMTVGATDYVFTATTANGTTDWGSTSASQATNIAAALNGSSASAIYFRSKWVAVAYDTRVYIIPLTYTGSYASATTDTGTALVVSQPNATQCVAPQSLFVAQTAWNVDKMDGSGASGATLTASGVARYSVEYNRDGSVLFAVFASNPVSGRYSRFPVHHIPQGTFGAYGPLFRGSVVVGVQSDIPATYASSGNCTIEWTCVDGYEAASGVGVLGESGAATATNFLSLNNTGVCAWSTSQVNVQCVRMRVTALQVTTTGTAGNSNTISVYLGYPHSATLATCTTAAIASGCAVVAETSAQPGLESASEVSLATTNRPIAVFECPVNTTLIFDLTEKAIFVPIGLQLVVARTAGSETSEIVLHVQTS